MVPETEFSSAITRPLDVIQSIFQSHQNPSSPSSSSFTASVESHFADLFKDVDARQNIPNLTPSSLPRLLSDESLRSHPSGRLVRWRCMIQDTGLGTELFLRSTSASSSDGDDHTNSLRSNFYGAESRTVASTSDRSSLEQDDQVDPSNLAERSVVYAVSIPGQTRWANEFLGESVSNHLPSPSHSSSAVVGSHCEVESLSRSLGDLSLSSLLDTRGAAEKIEVVRQRISKAVEKARSIGGGRVSGRRRGPGGMGEGEEAGKGEGRGPRLVAISKLHPPSSILACHLGSGQIHFGENYVQEMVDKAKVLPKELKWHFVGGLQSNKGKLLATIPNLYLLETLDSIKAANVLEKALASPDAAKRSEPLRVYLQVNTSGEESKSGLAPLLEEEKEGVAEAKGPLLELAKHVIAKCPHIRFRGLMTIGSAANSTSVDASGEEFKDVGSVVSANPDFERLILSRKRLVSALRKDVQVREQAKRLDDADYETLFSDQEDETGGLELSMGMSSDLEVATMAGSDNVRVGTDCFGKRPPTRDLAMAGMKDELELGIEAALSKRNAEEAGGRKEEEGRALEGRTANLPSSPTSTFKDPYPQKAPIPEEEHVGGLIKIYDVEKAERLKTTQIVEVVGVLDTSSLPNADWQDLGSSSSSSPGQANRQAPCVHAILLEPEPETTFLPGLIEPGDQDSIKQTWNSRCREKLVKYLSSALGGDRLAAEYTLLALIARIHSKRSSLSIGSLSLNISNFPPPPSSSRRTILEARLSKLVPTFSKVDMSLNKLNDPDHKLFPKSEGENLQAGRLQLVKGTTVLVDETNMEEGQLDQHGLTNLRTLSQLLETGKLNYQFPFHAFEFETELNLIGVSVSKSLLNFDCHVVLQPTLEDEQQQQQVSRFYLGEKGLQEEQKEELEKEEDLKRFRKALTLMRSLDLEIPDQVARCIEEDFVQARKEMAEANADASRTDREGGGSGLNQEDLLRRINLARLVSISRFEEVLTLDTWKQVVALDRKRLERVRS